MGAACVQKRLDRALGSTGWAGSFPDTIVLHCTDIGSDHRALIVADKPFKRMARRLFRFDARWVENPEVRLMVNYVWLQEEAGSPMYKLWTKLKKVRHMLYDWARVGESNSARNIRTLQGEIEAVRRANPVDWDKLRDLEGDLGRQWTTEELFWKQKSRVRWLKEGDRNSSYFHTVTRTRRRKNFIAKLRCEDGGWVEEEPDKAKMAVEFFDNLFTSEFQIGDVDARVAALPIEWLVTTDMNQKLVAPVSADEIRRTVFSIGPTQAPGSDGFTAKFFRSYWDIVGPLVVEAVGSFFANGKLLRSFNHTWITLIPKVEEVETMRQLRPISLCQVIYKIVSKILANRLAVVLPVVVSPEQNAFIKERQIVDNVLIGHEIMHYLKIKTKGKKGYMALKVDMEKAYDRVEWPFLLSLLKKLGFGEQWVKWIHECISSSS
ncbi:unnamed protein product [Linum trigynum]|uniref:Reverse transcriptase domain-containing protein n=1 Tax=Linum trigynum TaxID=586398 RepID=A0AAV2EVB3_9ROSI